MLPPTIKQVLRAGAKPNIKVFGHVKSVRSSKKVGFVDVCDGTGKPLSAVFTNPVEFLEKYPLKVGQSVSVGGDIVESKGKGQDYELKVDSLEIIGNVPESYPMQKKSVTMQTLRTLPTLRHRTATLASMLRLRSTLEARFFDFFSHQSFTKVHPPILTSSDCEGAGETFRIEKGKQFFGNDTYLTVSSQLHLEVLSQSLNRVWTMTPCFRAEDSHTNRHLSEFWMVEAEISHVDSVHQMTGFVESMIKSVVAEDIPDLVQSRFSQEEKNEIANRFAVLRGDWKTITYSEAIDIINQKLEPIAWGDSLATAHEKWLAGEHFKSPVFITDYPKEQKPFYMPLSEVADANGATVACFDLIIPEIGELVGGSMRQWQAGPLREEMIRRGMDCGGMDWYLGLRENGTVNHGGFGMGFERLVEYLGAMDNIREVIAFPRAPEECDC